MLRKKRLIKRLLPPILIIFITVVMSIYAYRDILKMEEDNCWEILENTATTINNEIKVRFKDNILILKLAANAMVQENRVESYEAITQHINAFQPMTIFNRIDIFYPNNKVLLQSGEWLEIDTQAAFDYMGANGENMSKRTTDIITGKEIIYYSVPIVSGSEIKAILTGVIFCDEMPKLFNATAYDGEAVNCLIDYSDGSFILDDWHDELGNIFEMKQRKQLKGYEDVDLVDDVKHGRTGVTAYQSAENGKNSYMYYTPVEIFNWELLIIVQEDVAFNSCLKLKSTLFTLGVVEAILFSAYFIWAIITVSLLEKSKKEIEEKKQEFEQLSYMDTLTGVYNRNKYNNVLEEYQNQSVKQLGIAFLDLNGLKKVNDERGHKIGDILIQNTVNCINRIFPNSTYRIGGDEFVALAIGMPEEEFNKKVEEVRTLLCESEISVSIGIIWREQCDDLNEQLKEADSQMYEEKKLFYKTKQSKFMKKEW